jgi:hypothetical protein
MRSKTLPRPSCSLGYTEADLAAILGPDLIPFRAWFSGQTGAICDGRLWDGNRYVDSTCGPHGPVVYGHDLVRFIEGKDDAEWSV